MLERRVVAIHQPNFFPWLGFFDKIACSTIFLFMDNAQFQKTGGTWTNRVQLLIDGRPAWATIPVVRRYHGVMRIADMTMEESGRWRGRFLRSIEISYGRAPEFNAVFPLLERLARFETTSIADFNVNAVTTLTAELGLDAAKLRRGSGLGADGKATDLLISMVQAVGGTAYLTGGGAADYQEDEKLRAAGIEVVMQRYQHPEYPQFNSTRFVPGLSVIDGLMNVGFEGVGTLLRKGARE